MGDATIFVSLAAGRMGLLQVAATGDGDRDRDPKTWGTTTEEKKRLEGLVGIASLLASHRASVAAHHSLIMPSSKAIQIPRPEAANVERLISSQPAATPARACMGPDP